jgi:hypothetical protein
MRTALIQIEGLAPYCQSRFHGIERLNKEGPEAYETRTWPNKAHWDRSGNIEIPALALKSSLAEAAKYLSKQIPGKGKSTYRKHFESGVLVLDSPVIKTADGTIINKSMLDEEGSPYKGRTIFCSADGTPGSGKRVHRMFPLIEEPWFAEVHYTIIDDTIVRDVFEEHLRAAGNFIGIGAFRVRNRGIWGRYQHRVLDWQDEVSLAA